MRSDRVDLLEKRKIASLPPLAAGELANYLSGAFSSCGYVPQTRQDGSGSVLLMTSDSAILDQTALWKRCATDENRRLQVYLQYLIYVPIALFRWEYWAWVLEIGTIDAPTSCVTYSPLPAFLDSSLACGKWTSNNCEFESLFLAHSSIIRRDQRLHFRES